MQLSKKKNTIVLKGMASNVIDEAIVVLKPNIKLKQSEYNSKGKASSDDRNKKMIVLKEAENTINMYVKKLEGEVGKKEDRNLKLKYKFLQVCNIILVLTIVTTTLILL